MTSEQLADFLFEYYDGHAGDMASEVVPAVGFSLVLGLALSRAAKKTFDRLTNSLVQYFELDMTEVKALLDAKFEAEFRKMKERREDL